MALQFQNNVNCEFVKYCKNRDFQVWKSQTSERSQNEKKDIPNVENGVRCSKKRIDFTNRLLHSIPKIIFTFNLKHISHIILNRTNLKELPEECGVAFPNLQFLSLNDNSLQKLPLMLGNLTNLKNLYICNNKISEISAAVCRLPRLEILDMSHNHISYLPEEFASIPLVEFTMTNNSLEKLPKTFSNMRFLKVLKLSHNSFVNIDIDSVYFQRLRTLHLDHNQLSTLPNFVKSLQSLKDLNVSHNYIEVMPETLLSCNSLGYLDLNCNHLKFVPAWINNMSSVAVMNLCGNALTGNVFYQRFCETCSDLQTMDISRNCGSKDDVCRDQCISRNVIHCLPVNFGMLKKLTEVHLSGIELFELPETFGELCALKRLEVSENELYHLPESFCDLGRLEICNLSGNNIQLLPLQFGRLTSLRTAFLSSNDLVELPDSFVELVNLKFLDISDNLFDELPDVIYEMKNLTTLIAEKELVDNSRMSEKLRAAISVGTNLLNGRKLRQRNRSRLSVDCSDDERSSVLSEKDDVQLTPCSNHNDTVEDWDEEINKENPYGNIFIHPDTENRREVSRDVAYFCPGAHHTPQLERVHTLLPSNEGQFEDAD